ncbi:hypothetical protein [Streptomyces flaveolus]|uniref:hypothetical protein n=1 Tax=Streptomyces flaveolus TaxID=67297 RepID=UPI0016708C37|nr:hypothetical protein [Streptomyces flaveolus]GGQ85651.1 hypothetical protein GCM10010216_54440 [Streptomyces flaveolus]
MENRSPLPSNVPPRPSSAPTTANSKGEPYGWRDEYEADPEYQRILAAMESPWWKRPLVLWGGMVAVAVGSFFLGGIVLGADEKPAPSSPSPWVQDQAGNQQQNGQPAEISAAQKSQTLSSYCNQQAGGPYNVSEADYLDCLHNNYVTDQGQVMPR